MRLIPALAAAALAATPVLAQDGPPQRGPFFLSFDGLYVHQGETDLEDGGTFSVDRTFIRGGGLYRFDNGASAGLFVSRGWLDYDFGAAAPWGSVNDIAITAPINLPAGDRLSLFASPTLRYDYEDGAEASDGQTYGVFLGASWEVNERLSIGPAFGAVTELEQDGLTLFPALLIDWDVTDRLNVSTGPTIGASRGPGLAVNYDLGRNVSVGLAGRYEEVRFRLSDDGPAPGGVGQDSSVPVVVTFDYSPFPRTGVSAFAGVELGGRLRIEDADGSLVDVQDYDPAPIFGAAVRLAF